MTTTLDYQTRSLQVRAATANEESMTVDAILATEAPVEVMCHRRYEPIHEVLTLDGARYPDSVSLLDSHSRESVDDVLGSVRAFRKQGGALVVTLHFDRDDERAVRAFRKVAAGHVRDLSVGYRVREATDVQPGQTVVINGREWAANGKRLLRVATEWQVKEGSILAIGADERAKVRGADAPQKRKGAEMPDQKPAEGVSAPSDDQARQDDAVVITANTSSGVTVTADNTDAIQAAVAADRKRAEAIRGLASDRTPADLLRRAIDEGWSVEKTSFHVLKAERDSVTPAVGTSTRGGTVANGGTAPQGFVFGNYEQTPAQDFAAISYGLRHAICQDQRRSDPIFIHPLQRGDRLAKKAAERAAEQGYKFRNLALTDYVREALEVYTGKRAPRSGEVAWRQFHKLMVADQLGVLPTRAGFSGGDLANIFTTNVNAVLVQQFEETPDSTAQLCRERDVENFLTQERPRKTQFDSLEKLPSGDTAKHFGRTDIVETYKVHRYAKQWVVDEQDLINDRIGAFTDDPLRMGIAAARVRPDLFYAGLLNGATAGLASGALFTSGQNNLDSNAFSAANLATGIETMMVQTETDSEGNSVNLNIEAAFIVAACALKFTVLQTIRGSMIVATDFAQSASTTTGSANVLENVVTPIFDSRIDNGVTDPESGVARTATTTGWWLLADPIRHPTFEIGYIRGTGRVPVLDQHILTDGSFGLRWTVKHDVGYQALAYQGMYRGNA